MATDRPTGVVAGGSSDDGEREGPGARLPEVLAAARDRGLLGPGELRAHVDHARGFRMPAASGAGPTAVDLGAGAGVPGLVLALDFPEWRWTFVEASARRVAFLQWAVGHVGVGDRVRIEHARAELVGRSEDHRGRYDVVVARGFGPPAATAECAAPLLRLGGRALVSDPPAPGRSVRWPAGPLAVLGLRVEELRSGPPAVAELRCIARCPDRFPRRDGVPRRRPLWRTELFHVEPSRAG